MFLKKNSETAKRQKYYHKIGSAEGGAGRRKAPPLNTPLSVVWIIQSRMPSYVMVKWWNVAGISVWESAAVWRRFTELVSRARL